MLLRLFIGDLTRGMPILWGQRLVFSMEDYHTVGGKAMEDHTVINRGRLCNVIPTDAMLWGNARFGGEPRSVVLGACPLLGVNRTRSV